MCTLVCRTFTGRKDLVQTRPSCRKGRRPLGYNLDLPDEGRLAPTSYIYITLEEDILLMQALIASEVVCVS
jgi:hypothetical protein